MGRDRAPRRQFKRVALAEFQARALRYLPTCRKEIYEALCRIASTDEGVLPFIDRYLDRTEGRSGRKVQQPAAHWSTFIQCAPSSRQAIDNAEDSSVEMRCALGDDVEDGLHVRRRGRDDLKDLSGRGLLFESFGQGSLNVGIRKGGTVGLTVKGSSTPPAELPRGVVLLAPGAFHCCSRGFRVTAERLAHVSWDQLVAETLAIGSPDTSPPRWRRCAISASVRCSAR